MTYEELLQKWLDENVDLAKAIRPDDFFRIVKNSDMEGGRAHVDHTPHLNMHPPEIDNEVQQYRNLVVGSPNVMRAKSPKTIEGATSKMIYRVGAAPLLGQPNESRFMIKPYHEKLKRFFRTWGKYPIMGWAEMANQDMYHAGGIGHFHQKVHVSEHNLGPGHEKEPMLIVHMEPGMESIFQHHMKRFSGYHPEFKRDVKKAMIMDFLTNNMDRHGGNLLYNPQTGKGLAIDHGRNFQYTNNHLTKWRSTGHIPQMEDQLMLYLQGGTPRRPGAGYLVEPFDKHYLGYSGQMRYLDEWKPIIEEWWPQHSERITGALEKHVSYLKDPKLREHIMRNYNERRKMLDQMAEFGLDNFGLDWYNTAVPLYRPGERED